MYVLGTKKKLRLFVNKTVWDQLLPGIEFIYCQRKSRKTGIEKTIPPKFKRNAAEILGGKKP